MFKIIYKTKTFYREHSIGLDKYKTGNEAPRHAKLTYS